MTPTESAAGGGDISRDRALPRLDRHFWLALLLSALVILPRSASISIAQNENLDASFHLRLGFRFITGNPGGLILAATDAPLGQVLLCLPMIATGSYPSREIDRQTWPAGLTIPGVAEPGNPPKSESQARYERTIRRAPLYGNPLRPETLLLLIGLWKSILFLPAIAVVFQWCRALYGVSSAWLAVALVTIDPTIGSHIPAIALDTLGVTAILIACFCIWRYFEAESLRRLVVMGVAIAAALLIKHTAVILPGVVLVFAAVYWGWRPWRQGTPLRELVGMWRRRLNALLTLMLVTLLSMWVLLLFDYSAPLDQCFGIISYEQKHDYPSRGVLLSFLERKWPGGTYIGCFTTALLLNKAGGQPALLWGEIKSGGWWYYFPALATFKVPLGMALVLVLGLLSLARRRSPVRWPGGELSLLIPLLGWTLFLMFSNFNYSFRHFMPAYVFLLMWASRCVAGGAKAWAVAACIGLLAAIFHVAAFHPDQMSYVNFPRKDLQYQITDGNLDWGQSIRQIDDWLADHPEHAGRTVHLHARADGFLMTTVWYLGDRVNFVTRGKSPPTDGLLVISPVRVCGVYDEGANLYTFLEELKPIGWVGHSMPVYDLNRDLPRPTTRTSD